MERSKIEIRRLYKAFGDRPELAVNTAQASPELDQRALKDRTGQFLALRDISLTVRPGEIFVIMGLSGSGKSTLLRCVNRLQETTAGQVLVDGTDVYRLSAAELRRFRRQHFGMVFQHFALLPHRSVLENAVLGLEIQEMPRPARYRRGREVLKVVGLEHWADSPTGELSGGMQQRVGLARALAVDPEILLMDEPFSALDPLIRTDLQDELLKLHREMAKTVLFVTHDLNEAIKLGNRIAILDQEGRLVQTGRPEEIVLAPANEYISRFLGDVDRPAVIRAESAMRAASAEADRRRSVNRLSPIKDLLPLVLESAEPVAVVDDDGRLLGEITRQEVARIL